MTPAPVCSTSTKVGQLAGDALLLLAHRVAVVDDEEDVGLDGLEERRVVGAGRRHVGACPVRRRLARAPAERAQAGLPRSGTAEVATSLDGARFCSYR